MNELIQIIQSSMSQLPNAQKQVAAFVLEHYKEIPFLSVTSMAEAIGVSDTTIIKFCIRLGFDGFSDFKKVISGHVQSEVTMVHRLESHLSGVGDEDTLDKVLACDVQNLRWTLNNPHNRNNFDQFVKLLKEAGNIHVMGFRNSAVLTQYMVLHLRQLNRNVHEIIPALGEFPDKLSVIREGDLFVGISFTRYSKTVCQSMQYIKERGIATALITDSPLCPCYPYADIPLFCGTKSLSHELSYVGFFSLVNALVVAISRDTRDETTEHLKRLEDLFTAFNTFST